MSVRHTMAKSILDSLERAVGEVHTIMDTFGADKNLDDALYFVDDARDAIHDFIDSLEEDPQLEPRIEPNE